MVDWVPEILQAGARIRGAWLYQSTNSISPDLPDGLIYAPLSVGSRLLLAGGTNIYAIPEPTPGAAVDIGDIPATRQNPVSWRDWVVVPASNGTSPGRRVYHDGANYQFADLPAGALTGRYATVWKDRAVFGNSAAYPRRVAFSKPGDPATWNALSVFDTTSDVTGLAQQRTQVLVFHSSSVERLRGSTPPDSTLTDQTGDMIRDSLFDRAGCYDARSIAYWNENVLFCDSRGIHLTDGAATKNLSHQGGISNLWRDAWERPVGTPPLTTGAVVHRDYYIVTVRHTGYPPVTFVVDLPTRRAFTLGNIHSPCFAAATGVRERLFGADTRVQQVTDLTPMFDPNPNVLQVDADGSAVLPVLATAWMPLSKEPSMKRITDLHLSYEAYADGNPEVLRLAYVNAPNGADQTLGEFRATTKYVRKKMWVRRRLPGVAFKLTQLVATRDSRIYDLSLRAFPEEDSHL
jgi:hypothetical protein